MPCAQCPHCREIAERADLVLPTPSPRSTPGGIDRAFYRAFGTAYELARARNSQPGKALRSVNPGLTEARCGAYLKRARALGFVSSTRTERPPVAGVDAEPDEPTSFPVLRSLDDPEVAAWLAQARADMLDE